MDGARIANAAAALGCSLRELTVEAGVDVLTFGGTKNGLLYGEAVIYLRPELATRARFAHKQAGQLASKMRFIAAQFDALLTDQLWLNNAHHANQAAALLADRIADTPHVEILRAPQANSIFAYLPEPAIGPLQASPASPTAFSTSPDRPHGTSTRSLHKQLAQPSFRPRPARCL